MADEFEIDLVGLAKHVDAELGEQITALFHGKTMLATSVTMIGAIAFTCCQGTEQEANEFAESMIALLRGTIAANYSKKPEGAILQ